MTNTQKALLHDMSKLRGYIVDYCNRLKHEYSHTAQYHNSVVDWINKYRYSISNWLFDFTSSLLEDLEGYLRTYDKFSDFLYQAIDKLDSKSKKIDQPHYIEHICSWMTKVYKRLNIIDRYINNTVDCIKLSNKQLSSRDGKFIDQINNLIVEGNNLLKMLTDNSDDFWERKN